MTYADRLRRWSALELLALVACGGSSTQTTLIGGGLGGGTTANEVDLSVPTGANTTTITVDAGPAGGFSIGAVNVPSVTVRICTPGSATRCVDIDHVFLDTGSIGLRVFRSAVSTLALPPVAVPADVASGTLAGNAAECYPFVLGAVWGELATADVQIAGELASGLPVQLIDDSTPSAEAVPADCAAAADGQLMNSAAALQANGIIGIGMLAYDCGQNCASGNYSSGYALYYSCPAGTGSGCSAAALPIALQVQNPVTFFPVDNNGTLIAMPALPTLGAEIATGRLVFGIGTQSNNQLPPTATTLFVDPDPADQSYLYITTLTGGTSYPDSYIDSGTNALFFSDATIAQSCQSTAGATSAWYCPAAALQRTATLTDSRGTQVAVSYTVGNADALFSTPGLAFDDLAGSAPASSSSFVWGLPFFYGRTVYTSIWGQALSPDGPWNAF